MPGGQLAVVAGYYDQAHLISEFRHLARMTPRDFANRHRHGAAGGSAARGCEFQELARVSIRRNGDGLGS
jgi:AraC-like DNA-binding protein